MLKTTFVGVRVVSMVSAFSLSLMAACSDIKENKKTTGKGKAGEPVAAADGTGKSTKETGKTSTAPVTDPSALPPAQADKALPTVAAASATFEATCAASDKSAARKACVYSADLASYGLDPSALDPYLTPANLALLYAGQAMVPTAAAGGVASVAAVLAAVGSVASQPAASGAAQAPVGSGAAKSSSSATPASVTPASAGTGKIGAFSVHWGRGESICAAQSATYAQATSKTPTLSVDAFRRGLRCVEAP